MPAGRGGKVKTMLQAVALSMLMAPIPWPWPLLAGVLTFVAVTVTLATGVDYVLQARRLVTSGRAARGVP